MRPWRSRLPEQVRALPVGRGEKVLAGAVTRDGAPVGGTRDAFYARRHAQVPMGHMGEAWDVANAALCLAEPSASYLTGVSLDVDGGRNI